MAVDVSELTGIPLFASLSEAELEELACWFDLKTAGEGVKLTGEGATGYSFFVITEGEVVVTANGTERAKLGPGEFFGEMAILGDGRRNATVTTAAPTRLLVMFGTEFRRLHDAHPEIAAQLEAAMAERTHDGA